MTRRGFLARSVTVLGGLVASCQCMPELAAAKEPKPVKFLRSRSPILDARQAPAHLRHSEETVLIPKRQLLEILDRATGLR